MIFVYACSLFIAKKQKTIKHLSKVNPNKINNIITYKAPTHILAANRW